MTRVQVASQRGSCELCRHSKATARTIRPSSTTTKGRYSAGSQVAYQPGKAANTAPAAVISQTSLPSHTGPMVRSIRCRSGGGQAGRAGQPRAGGGDQPDLVAVPHRADGAQHQVPVGGPPAEQGQQRG